MKETETDEVSMVCRHVNSKTKHILALKSQFKLHQIRDNNKIEIAKKGDLTSKEWARTREHAGCPRNG